MKIKTKLTGVAVLTTGILAAQTALAAPVSYSCQFDNQSYWGWIPEAAVITVDEAAETVVSNNSHFATDGQENYQGRLRGNGRRLMATFQTSEAETSAGRKIYVRYTWRMNRSDLSSTLSVQVNRHGQQHRSDGQCHIKN